MQYDLNEIRSRSFELSQCLFRIDNKMLISFKIQYSDCQASEKYRILFCLNFDDKNNVHNHKYYLIQFESIACKYKSILGATLLDA